MTGVRTGAQVAAGAVILVVAWQLIGASGLLGPGFPSLTSVLARYFEEGSGELFGSALSATALSALGAFTIGAGGGLVIAALRQAIVGVRDGLDRLAVTAHAIPHIGVAPVLVVTIGRTEAPLVLGAIAAYFPAYVAATRAFGTAGTGLRDLFTVFGSGRSTRFLRLYLPAAVPGLCDALRLAAPGAVLGTVLGEWFGAPDGIGLIIVSSAQNFQIDQLWAAAVLATSMALAGYGLFSLLQVIARRRFT
ncbi:ABC transporter permease [Amycolatopsis jejuensis]|uniref:ABC transporter permease n=1 Tax=Amycolatopsis jejuensis TaxID=330084 RepID=UPI000525E5C3|nr:ABC transporter permease subunit [Amycolatopsis jejuensis]